MAEKKPSKYSDHGTIGSPEELDTYGVWVKSEPQDLTASMAETVNFDAEAVPYADFDMEFDDTEESGYDFADLEPTIPEISIEGGDDDSFDEGITATTLERGGEEASTQLLMKIADELSAIRAELSTLKKEFTGVRVESPSGVKAETRHGGFFDGEEGDDEKITLTGDEMENILTSADFAEEEDIGFDAQREADEAALKELSAQNESAAGAEEEISIDFDNLGINLDDNAEVEAGTLDDFPPLETGADDDFETSSFDALSLDDMPAPEEIPSEDIPALEEQEDIQAFEEEFAPLEPLESIEEDEELRDLRLEGAVPITPAPDNSIYLETDPFALDDSGLTEASLEESSLGETSIEDISIEDISLPEETSFEETSFEETVPEETIPEETIPQDTASEITTDLSFDDVSFDLNVDDFSTESLSSPEDTAIEEESGAADLSAEDEINIGQTFESPEEETEAASDEPAFEAESLDLSEAVIDEPDLSAGIVEAPLEEPVLGDISFGDDISLDMDDFGAGIDLDIQDSPAEDSAGDSAESLAIDIDTSAGLGVAEDFSLADDSAGGLVMDDVETAGDVETDVELDTTGGLADADSPDGGLTDDLASDLALDDFDAGIDLATLPTALPDTDVEEESGGFADADDSLDDGLTGIIPEGFEVNAEEAPISADDDLEAFADEEVSLPKSSAVKAADADAGGDIDIPASFKSELKSVLSYMDHLLESLPEDKIEEFAKSEYFDSYKKIFKELGLV